MTATKRVFLIGCVIAVFALGGMTWLRVLTHASPSENSKVNPVTIVYQRLSFSDSVPTQPKFTRTEIEAIRSDGSVARAVFQPPVQDHAAFYERAVTDVGQGRHTLVDPFTESITTYPSQELVNRIRRKPANSCPGQAGEKVLGYETVSEVKTLTTNPRAGKTVTTVTTWRAPQLDCVMLRQETRTVRADGRILLQIISATVVTPGEPPAWFFEIPSDYTERSSSAVRSETSSMLGSELPERPGLDAAYIEANRPKPGPR
jgi:hypothetical protein